MPGSPQGGLSPWVPRQSLDHPAASCGAARRFFQELCCAHTKGARGGGGLGGGWGGLRGPGPRAPQRPALPGREPSAGRPPRRAGRREPVLQEPTAAGAVGAREDLRVEPRDERVEQSAWRAGLPEARGVASKPARALISRAPTWAELTSSTLEKGLEPRHRRLGATAVEQLVLAARAGRATLAGRGWWTSRRGLACARPPLGRALPARGRRHAGSAAGDPQRRGGTDRRGTSRAPTELLRPRESPESTFRGVRKRESHVCYVALWRQNEVLPSTSRWPL